MKYFAFLIVIIIVMAIYSYLKKGSVNSIMGIGSSSSSKLPVSSFNISQKGINIIKRHERFMSKAYDDKQPWKDITSMNQVKGKLTIGYGHTKNERIGQVISETQAENLLINDLGDAERTVKSKVTANLNQNQYDALVSYVFNTGGSTNLFKLVNGSTTISFGGEIYDLERWWKEKYITSGGEEMGGLITRRKEEYELFIS